METKKTFKPFDKVIWRDTDKAMEDMPDYKVWHCELFSDEDESYYYLLGSMMLRKKNCQLLPYEGNEHLVGTTDEPAEEVKLEEGEWVMVSDKIEAQQDEWQLRYFLWINEDKLCIQSVRFAYPDPCPYNYAIKFSDFNPNDMEETKKHILCVKDGKIVKYLK